MKHVLVAGAGIVGVSTAIWLQRAGHKVTVIDRAGPASGTSFGNAGVLAAGAVVPVTVPGLLRKAPGMLIDRDAPLFLRWSYLPKLAPFLMRYLRFATADHVDHYAQAMATILHDSVDQHKALAAGTGAERFITESDYCFGYKTQASFEADAYGWSVRDKAGVAYETMSGRDYSQIDPLYDGAFETVVACKNHGSITDPGAYIKTLADHFVAEGGMLEIASISDVLMEDGRATGFLTDKGAIGGDVVVLATGAWSKPIAKKLGLDLHLESERGYHIELVDPSHTPVNPMMVAASKFVITPMQGRIRCAGVIEFGGLDAGPSKAPHDLLKRQFAELLPGISYERIDEWLGHRPAPADSLPLIGEIGGLESAFAGVGHQHVGLTGGPKSGRILADCIGGRSPNVDLAPFSPNKYKKSL